VVVGAAIVECGVLAEVRECRNLENAVETVGPEMEATCFAEEIHTDFLLAEDSLHQVQDLRISPFDLVSWNSEGSLSSVFGRGDSAGVELANSLEQRSYVVVFVETSLTAEHYSVMCVATAGLVLMEVHHWCQQVEGKYSREVLHEVVSNGDLDIHCFGLFAN
jgi:hypothetical protein